MSSQTSINITAYPDKTSDKEVHRYLMCVDFMANWFEKQNGASGKTTAELFDEFKVHVTNRMIGEVGGVG